MRQTSAPERDFRDEPVAASEEALTQWRRDSRVPPEADPVESGLSYCVTAEGDGQSVLRWLKRRTLASFVLCWVLFGVAIVAFGAQNRAEKRGTPHNEAALLALGGGAALGFAVLLFDAATVQFRVARRFVRDRMAVEREGASRPAMVSIEDGQTFQKLKAVPEDLGAVVLHPASRCVQIEGVTHRYMIYADDVVKVDYNTTSTNRAIVIAYAIGAKSLRIALFDTRLSSEFKRQTIGGRNRLFDQIRAILESEATPPSHTDA